ncbi:MAG TPA: histidine phosphatase family protein [Patescibacteria group bacterium]
MALPADLVLVRHGESEANLVKDEIRAGNVQAYTDAFAKANNWQTRLTDKGRAQAKAVGEYIRAEIGAAFDARFFSYFVRTRETAGLLGVDGPNWQRSPYLHERDWGVIDSPAPEKFEESDYKRQMAERKSNPLFWRPPNGERVIDVAMRFDRVLQTIHRDVNDGRIPERGRAILVTHGEVIDAARVPLEKMDEVKFFEWINAGKTENKSHNGQVIHYTRRLDPDNPDSELARKVMFRRSVCPWDRSLSSDAWVRIEHPTYTDEELLEGAERYPSLIKAGE